MTGILGLRFFSVPVLDNGGVYFVFIFSHLYLHGSRIRGDLHVPEMVEEKQYAKSQANGVGDFQNGEASGAFPGDLGINPEKSVATSASVLKVMIEKAAPKKEARQIKATLRKWITRSGGAAFS